MLAFQLALALGGVVRNDLVVRRVATRQQAKLVTPEDRIENMRDVFGPGPGLSQGILGPTSGIILVDDLVTSGATAGTMVSFLRSWGRQVVAVVCLGVARPD